MTWKVKVKMNDTTKGVRAYMYTLLNGNVSHDSNNVNILNLADESQSYPYILIRPSVFSDNGTKDRFGGVHTIDIEIHYRYKIKEGGGFDDVDEIADTVLGLARLRNLTSDLGDDTVYIFKQIASRHLTEDDDQYWYVTKVITFEAYVLSDS
jgi:hypothetical protein